MQQKVWVGGNKREDGRRCRAACRQNGHAAPCRTLHCYCPSPRPIAVFACAVLRFSALSSITAHSASAKAHPPTRTLLQLTKQTCMTACSFFLRDAATGWTWPPMRPLPPSAWVHRYPGPSAPRRAVARRLTTAQQALCRGAVVAIRSTSTLPRSGRLDRSPRRNYAPPTRRSA